MPPNPAILSQTATLKVSSKSKGKINQRMKSGGIKGDSLVQSNLSELSGSISSQVSISNTDPRRKQAYHQSLNKIGKNRPIFELPYK